MQLILDIDDTHNASLDYMICMRFIYSVSAQGKDCAGIAVGVSPPQ